jgi:predicted phosphohydrolase
VTVFHLPCTKVLLTGNNVYWAAQSGMINLHAALLNHLAVNSPGASKALFSWKHKSSVGITTWLGTSYNNAKTSISESQLYLAAILAEARAFNPKGDTRKVKIHK